MSKKTVCLISLGCPKNLVDSEILMGGLKHEDFDVVDDSDGADTVIINTCGFLDIAREESVETILHACELKKAASCKRLVVMGCFSERYSQELRTELPEVDQFFGVNEHCKIISYLTGKDHLKYDPHYFRSLMTPSHYAYLKIADGCNNGCSFCSIPLIRGLQRSRTVSDIISEAERLTELGVKELILIAQDTTSYGWDLRPKRCLQDLLLELDKVDGLRWIRILYAHPAHLSRKVIDVMANSEKICHYLDLPIQHASNRLLKSMRRTLGKEGMRKRIEYMRSKVPDIALRTSLIVGYPGETEKDFRELLDFVEEVRFERLGVFIYSREEGTMAAELEDDVPERVKWDRRDAIMTLQQDIALGGNSKFMGREIEVLIDKVEDGISIGRTKYDSPEIDNVVTVNEELDVGSFYRVMITDYSEYELSACPLSFHSGLEDEPETYSHSLP